MSYASTKIGNPCIHCGDTTGDCRQHRTLEMHLCVKWAGSRKGEKSQGYVYIGDSKCGRWAMLLPDKGENYTSEKIRELREEWRRLEEQAKRERLAAEMPATERDKHYREILAQLSLHPEDKANLVKRGFCPEQIERCGFMSVTKWQSLRDVYPGNLPGIGKDGKSLLTPSAGYLCPIRNHKGLIVGMQVRKRIATEGSDQRYHFLSQDGSIRIDDQIPLAVFSGELPGVVLVEGVGAKPFLASSRLNVSIIGAAGGNWASSPKHLKNGLEARGAKPGDIISICPDAGSVSNAGVVGQYMRAASLLQSLGYAVNFLWWGQVDKTFGDIDELVHSDLARITHLSLEEFKGLCAKWGGLEPEKISKLVPLDYDERVAVAQRKLHSLSYPIDLKCDPQVKYLPDLVGRIPLKGIVGLECDKGTGKSHQINEIKRYCCGYWQEVEVAPEIDKTPQQLELLPEKKKPEIELEEPKKERIFHKGVGMKFLSINARIALGREQAIRWEFTWIEDADIDGKQEFGGEKIASLTIVENLDGIGLCWDSLAKVMGRDWANTLVVMDEIELGLNHLTTSSTCKDRRSLILHVLESKLKECLANDGLVIAADADLSDSTMDYLIAIAPGHPPFIVHHRFNGDPCQITFRTGKRDGTLDEIVDWLADKDCQPIAIALDNQKECEAIAELLTTKYSWLRNPKGGLIRVDSKITQTDFGKKFVAHINESVLEYQPKVLLYTPSLGVGCSIDIKYFAHVFGLFFGNIEPSQARQALARVRDSVPRTVWAKNKGATADGDPTSLLPDEIKRRLFAYNGGYMMILQDALVKAQQEIGTDNPEDKDVLPRLIAVLEAMMGEDGTWNNPHVDLWCNQIARRNFAMSQYAVQLRQELIDERHILNDDHTEASSSTGDEVKQVKAQKKEKTAEAVAVAPNISFEVAQDLKRKPTRTTEEEHQIAKAFLKQDLPGVELTKEFVHKARYKDDGRWLAQTRLFWFTQNLEALKDRDEKEWRHHLTKFAKGVPFLPDVKVYTPKAEAILKSGVLDFVKLDELDKEYSDDSPEAKEFVKRCYKHRKALKVAFNITVTLDAKPIQLANKILEKVGLIVRQSNKIKQSKEVTRYYKLDIEAMNDGDRQSVLNSLNERFSARTNQNAEMLKPQGLDRGQHFNKSLYKNESVVPENKPGDIPLANVLQEVTQSQEETVIENEPVVVAPPKKVVESAFKVGDRVTHIDMYHRRGGFPGVIEGFNEIGEAIIHWECDGDNQKHPAHRSYSDKDLRIVA